MNWSELAWSALAMALLEIPLVRLYKTPDVSTGARVSLAVIIVVAAITLTRWLFGPNAPALALFGVTVAIEFFIAPHYQTVPTASRLQKMMLAGSFAVVANTIARAAAAK